MLTASSSGISGRQASAERVAERPGGADPRRRRSMRCCQQQATAAVVDAPQRDQPEPRQHRVELRAVVAGAHVAAVLARRERIAGQHPVRRGRRRQHQPSARREPARDAAQGAEVVGDVLEHLGHQHELERAGDVHLQDVPDPALVAVGISPALGAGARALGGDVVDVDRRHPVAAPQQAHASRRRRRCRC